MAEKSFCLLPENLPSFGAFLAARTQWRVVVGPTGIMVRTGMDYGGVDTMLRRRGFRGRKLDDVFADVQVMETAMMRALAVG